MSARSKGGEKLVSANRKARHDFHIEKTIEAGVVLSGSEVKSARNGQVQLVDAFASFTRGELWLHKANIAEYKQGGPYFNHPPVRDRKLLLHRRELRQLQEATQQQGYTLVPLRVYFKHGVLKVELGLGRGKTKGDKRASDKASSATRDMAKAVRRDRRSSASYDDD